jgi:zinc protease
MRRLGRVGLAACFALAGAGAAAQAERAAGDLLPFHATEKTLANGLRIVVVPTGLPDIVSLQIPVQTGSRNEIEPGRSGFAHFFEHMMFRGTQAYPAARYQEILQKTGARQNAYTTDDYTNYHTTFAKEDLETVLRIEADRFRNLSYSQDDFKTESRAVLGEYNKNSANPSVKLGEVMRDKAFQVHTYKHTTMGFLEDIENMPNEYAYSRTFFDRWYRPNNTTLIIAGDVEPRAAIALVEKYWGGWRRGSYAAAIPAEPPPQGPVYAHVPWSSPTLPLMTVAFHGPAFSERSAEYAAFKTLLELSFGPTSEIYKRLVQDEQKVDELEVLTPARVDPALMGVHVRLKRPEDAVAVRDEILRAVARIRDEPVTAARLSDARSAERFGLLSTLDNTERIAATLAQYVHFRREYATINEYYRVVAALRPEDLQAAARRYLTDRGMVVATLSKDPLPAQMAQLPALQSLAGGAAPLPASAVLVQKSVLPQIQLKILFPAGSAYDPPGKEGLAALTAAMVASAGSAQLKIDEIEKAFYPWAASFTEQVDKEMTTFSGSVHRSNWDGFAAVALPMLISPGFREEDFRRLKDAQRAALVEDLRGRNEEELAKERLQADVYAGTAYGHPALGTLSGIDSITLEDVRRFWAQAYTRGAVRVGVSGDVSGAMLEGLERELGRLGEGPGLPPLAAIAGARPAGIEVEIIDKPTRATAISFGFPIEVTRAHPDYAALWVAKTWLGEHRSLGSHLFQRIREVRGMNYGDYAYTEAFPRGMFQFFPDPNLARRAQLFEVWIRPVAPENAQMALRIAVHELERLVEEGLSAQEFESTRDYLVKYVALMTATQAQRLGYALDSQWYGLPEYTKMMREALARMTVEDVNGAIRRHLSARNLSVVMVAGNAEALKQTLLADAFSPIRYDGNKPPELLEEDRRIGALKLGISPQAIRVTPVEQVFAR